MQDEGPPGRYGPFASPLANDHNSRGRPESTYCRRSGPRLRTPQLGGLRAFRNREERAGIPLEAGVPCGPPVDCCRREGDAAIPSIYFLFPLRRPGQPQALVHALAARKPDGIVAEGHGPQPRNGEARIEFESRASSFARVFEMAEMRQRGGETKMDYWSIRIEFY